VAGTSFAELVSHAAELERRDSEVAEELERLAEVADRAGALRARAAEIRETLERLPNDLDELGRRGCEASAELEAARREAAQADERVVALSRSRRRKGEELDRAEREAATARELLADAEARVERLVEREGALRATEPGLRDEADELVRAATSIAGELARMRRVPDAAGLQPEKSLAELDEWGLFVRSAVLVARGTLETERERIVVEANALAAGALGEPFAGSSVALVRRRIEELASL
jgi:chromosome segregation ATPase